MNIDIVASVIDGGESGKALVNYGEPDPKKVFFAAYGSIPSPEIIPKIKTIIEELDDEMWEIFSLEYGAAQKNAQFWVDTDLFYEYTPDQLHQDHDKAMGLFRTGCQERNIAAAVTPN